MRRAEKPKVLSRGLGRISGSWDGLDEQAEDPIVRVYVERILRWSYLGDRLND